MFEADMKFKILSHKTMDNPDSAYMRACYTWHWSFV